MEGLYQVLKWRLDNTITSLELTIIYKEWLKANGHNKTLAEVLIEDAISLK